MRRAEDAGIKTGVLGLDPRTHLVSFLAVGIAAMLVTGLLETALLQVIAAAYLAANGRQRLAAKTCASFAAMGPSAASTGPESDPGFALMRRCQADELAAALSRLPAVQLRRLLMHAVVRLPVREIARREGCSERAVKCSLARARRRMRALLTDGD